MPTHVSNGHAAGLGDAAKQVAERASALARLEARLAAIELKQKLSTLSAGIGLRLAPWCSRSSLSASSSRAPPPASRRNCPCGRRS